MRRLRGILTITSNEPVYATAKLSEQNTNNVNLNSCSATSEVHAEETCNVKSEAKTKLSRHECSKDRFFKLDQCEILDYESPVKPDQYKVLGYELPAKRIPHEVLGQKSSVKRDPHEVLGNESPAKRDPYEVLDYESSAKRDPYEVLGNKSPLKRDPHEVLGHESPATRDLYEVLGNESPATRDQYKVLGYESPAKRNSYEVLGCESSAKGDHCEFLDYDSPIKRDQHDESSVGQDQYEVLDYDSPVLKWYLDHAHRTFEYRILSPIPEESEDEYENEEYGTSVEDMLIAINKRHQQECSKHFLEDNADLGSCTSEITCGSRTWKFLSGQRQLSSTSVSDQESRFRKSISAVYKAKRIEIFKDLILFNKIKKIMERERMNKVSSHSKCTEKDSTSKSADINNLNPNICRKLLMA